MSDELDALEVGMDVYVHRRKRGLELVRTYPARKSKIAADNVGS
jgi:hypothetical protein